MARLFLPLLPLPALAVLAAISCSRPRPEEPAQRIVPPPAPYAEPAAREAAAAAAAPRPTEEPPSADELRAFERPVAK
jgi:hypothetical protein